ncbi:MAG: hypothetical protein M3309_15065 [Actinomycetota bacterium]|nr:hypothetical protein [Actinomycetota bacterium]
MDTQAIVGIIIVAVVVLILAILLVLRRRRERRIEERRERTREEFGEEYERVTQERGSEKEAERELRQRRGRVERQVEPLSEESRQRYEERWGELERVFVDNPERSIELADRTILDVLEERNFIADPAQEDRETEQGLTAMYPEVADDYREARRLRARVVGGAAVGDDSNEETEEMRQALRR